jgi:hypothetical protein
MNNFKMSLKIMLINVSLTSLIMTACGISYLQANENKSPSRAEGFDMNNNMRDQNYKVIKLISSVNPENDFYSDKRSVYSYASFELIDGSCNSQSDDSSKTLDFT